MDSKIVHMYSQESWCAEASIIANRAGLEALKEAIDRALNEGTAEVEVMVSDGEKYDLRVMLEESPGWSVVWTKMAVPYINLFVKENREDAIWPQNIWDKLGGKPMETLGEEDINPFESLVRELFERDNT